MSHERGDCKGVKTSFASEGRTQIVPNQSFDLCIPQGSYESGLNLFNPSASLRTNKHVTFASRSLAHRSEDFEDFWIHWNLPILAALCLRYNQNSTREVHSVPSETKLFTLPHPGSDRYLYHRLQVCASPAKRGHQRWLFFRQ